MPMAVDLVRQITSLTPTRVLWESITNVVDGSPESLESWTQILLEWVGRGFRRNDVVGMLRAYHAGGIADRNPNSKPNHHRRQSADESIDEMLEIGRRQRESKRRNQD